jgi:2-polyprenyl-3-methyl-5-hydroxy-6-metoxy-1,4-benzoquinol methylase
MKTIHTCALCNKSDIVPYQETKDHFLSNEPFTICKCHACGFLFTNPIPSANDLGKYYQSDEYLSHSKSKKGIFSKIYNLIRKYSVKKKYQLISEYVAIGSILDIGCGTGEVLKYFSEKGWQTKGIEPSDEARRYAVENLGLSVEKENYISTIVEKSFDVVSMWHVLEHVPQLNERMQQINCILKDEGVAFIALPNYKSWDAQYYSTEWAAWDVPRHLYHFSKESFLLLANKHKFQIAEIIPMKFDAFYVSLLSGKYRSGRMNYIQAFYQGFKSNKWAKKNNDNFSSLIYVLKKDLS